MSESVKCCVFLFIFLKMYIYYLYKTDDRKFEKITLFSCVSIRSLERKIASFLFWRTELKKKKQVNIYFC